jgi:hypothetical protein
VGASRADRLRSLEPVRLTGVCKKTDRGIVALVFLCKVTGGQLTTSSETDAFRWAAENEISELTSEAYAVRVTDAMHDRKQHATGKPTHGTPVSHLVGLQRQASTGTGQGTPASVCRI